MEESFYISKLCLILLFILLPLIQHLQDHLPCKQSRFLLLHIIEVFIVFHLSVALADLTIPSYAEI